MRRPWHEDPEIATTVGGHTDADNYSTVAIWFGTMAGVVWPRTRGVAIVGLCVLISRAAAARMERLEQTIADLFDRKTATHERIDELAKLIAMVREGQGMNAEENLRSIAEAEERILTTVSSALTLRVIDLERLIGWRDNAIVGGPTDIMSALGRVRSRLDVADRCTCPPGVEPTSQEARDGDCPVHSVPF